MMDIRRLLIIEELKLIYNMLTRKSKTCSCHCHLHHSLCEACEKREEL